MQRPFQRRASGSDRRVNSRQRRGSHARGESRCVEFMICVKNKNRVEHPRLPRLRHCSSQFIKEVSCVLEIWPFRQWLLALRNSPTIGNQGGNTRDQADRLANV